MKNTPKIIGGVSDSCNEAAATLYAQLLTRSSQSPVQQRPRWLALENTFRAVNIGLVNEVAIIADKLKLDVWEIIQAAASKPFGFMPFYPGPDWEDIVFPSTHIT